MTATICKGTKYFHGFWTEWAMFGWEKNLLEKYREYVFLI